MNLGLNINKKVLIKFVIIILFIILIIYSLLTNLTNTNLTDTNLVANPSFESGSMKPLNWTFVTNNGNTPTWDNVNHSGTKSIKTSILETTEMESAYLISDLIKVEPQCYYIFSAWGKTENAGETDWPAIQVEELDANEKWIKQTNLFFGKDTNEWTQKTIDFQTSSNTTYIYIHADIWKGYGTFWLDDVALKIKTTKIYPQVPEQISSTTHYVAMNGNDNNSGTESQPWRTISKAARIAKAGDTVYVKEGVYNEQVWVENSGSSNKWITFAAYPGQSVTIDGTGLAMGRDYGLFNILGKSYIKVTGFRIINSEYSGFYVTQSEGIPSSNIIFSHNYLEKTWAAAIIMFGLSTAPAKNFIIDGNTLVQSHIGDDPMAHEGITLGHNVDGFEIKNNFITDSFVGQINAKSGVFNGKIYNNTCTNSTYSCVYIDGWTNGASNIEVFENTVHDMVSKNEDDVVSGFNVASEQGGLVENISFYNNTAYNNSGTALMIAHYSIGPVKNIKITGNTFYNNGIGYKERGGIYIDYDKATGVIIRDNIVSQNNEFQILSNNANTLIDRNFINGFRGYYSSETQGSNYS